MVGFVAMTPEEWRRVKELCDLALARPPDERPTFLAEACPDDARIRNEVEALIVHATTGEGVLDAPIWTATLRGALAIPPTFGRYRVLDLVGEGGMGAVYKAEQDRPHRIVALKVIKPGLAVADMLRRFERESEALARLQHPGIAQIYEVGTADVAGVPVPYFAMEFIDGAPLRNYADAHHLSLRERLELMVKVCDAVEHAHRRGIIHRDLKPGNILLDASLQPKVLDFGVARITDSDAQVTRQTDLGQMIGTLAYMSPEQVLADPLELDTRSDVYALGVILYELLASRLPYPVSGTLIEAVRAIQEEEPTRLSSINRVYRGDIETIVSKALEKDKSRRYPSAAALADDIRRYLTDQPITARPASATYHLGKFARRHKALVGAVIAVFVALTVGTVVSTWQAMRANNQAAIASAVSDFVRNDLLAQASARSQSNPNTKPDPDLKVRTALDRAAARIGTRFAGQPLVEASIRQTIGVAYQDLGLFPEARQQIARALELRKAELGSNDPSTLELMTDIGRSSMLEGKYPDAAREYEGALDGLRRAYGEGDARVLQTMVGLALVYQYQARYPQAEGLMRQVLDRQRRSPVLNDIEVADVIDNLGFLYLNQGKYPQAAAQYEDALTRQRRLYGDDHPNTISTIDGLALTYRGLGKRRESESLFQQALDSNRRVLGPDHHDTLGTMNNLALLYTSEGRYRDAGPLYEQVLEVKKRVLGADHPETLLGMNNLGNLYMEQGRYAEAEPIFTAALDGRRRVLGAEHPNTLNTMANIAMLRFRQGRWAEAETRFTEILATRRRVLGNEHPSTQLTINQLAAVYARLGKWQEAESALTPAREFWRRAFGAEHQQTLTAIDELGEVYMRRGDVAQAQPLLTQAYEARQRVLGAEHPDTLRSAVNVATLYTRLGRNSDAESLLRATVEIDRKLFG
jgi:serine/threonine protein kinase/Tfp pilus assembly protein PilF